METKKLRRLLCLILCIVLLLAGCGSGAYEPYTLTPNEYLMGETGAGNEYVPGKNTAKQLTAEDIQEMNGGDAYMVFDDDGYLTFLEGRFCEEKIEDYEQAVSALNGMASLIGMGAGSEFFSNYGQKDSDGYTYYVYQQRYGDTTVQYATLKIVIDPEGYTAGLSCSFTPNLGIAEETAAVTAAQAVDVVRQTYPQDDLTYYTDYTAQVAVTFNDVSYHAYAVYTSNPYAAGSFDMMYYEHFVSYSGEYLYLLPVASLSTDNKDAFKAEEYFKGMEPTTWTGDVTYSDGSTARITVPVAYNPADGNYYLCDTERKIMVASYYNLAYEGWLNFTTSSDGQTWRSNDLIAYYNYSRAYDFYASQGLYSVDGFGLPILICTGLCDQNGNGVDNACYCGINMGWACFAASDVNSYSEAMDVIAHEFTHGITTNSMCGMRYINETGAINEAYSDIMGNICEMLLGATWDTDQWLLAEMSGTVLRSMSNPGEYGQPTSVYDGYYYPPTDSPSQENDNGGVHQNSSLLSGVAYRLWLSGMSLEELRSLWVHSITLLTPLSGYEEVCGALLMSVDIKGYDPDYKTVIADAFSELGVMS